MKRTTERTNTMATRTTAYMLSTTIFLSFCIHGEGEQVGGNSTTNNVVRVEGATKAKYESFVRDVLLAPTATRVEKYQEKVRDLAIEESRTRRRVSEIEALVEEILKQGDYEGLTELEKSVDTLATKRKLWIVVMGKSDKKAYDLLKIWAERHPDSVELMQYLPDGASRLLLSVEDVALPLDRRVMAVRILADAGGEDILARLSRLETNTTVVVEPASKGTETFGEIVAQTSQKIRQRMNDRKKTP